MAIQNLESLTALGTELEEELPLQLPLLEAESVNILLSEPLPEVQDFFTFSFEESYSIEKNTRLQSTSQLWHEKRQNRFTSSNFGIILFV